MSAMTKKSPPSGQDGGRLTLNVGLLRGRNYSRIRAAVQPHANLDYDLCLYKRRTEVDDWFATYGLVMLTKPEYFALRFIIARTIYYGKSSELIKKSHFLEGIAINGEWKVAPCGLNSRDLYAALRTLADKNLIKISDVMSEKIHAGTLYTVDINSIIAFKEVKTVQPKLKIPKKQRETMVPNGTTPPLNPGAKWHLQNIINKREDNEVRSPSANAVRSRVRSKVEIDCKSAAEVIEEVRNRSIASVKSRAARAAVVPSNAITMSGLTDMWKASMMKHSSPGGLILGITGKEFAIFKNTIKGHIITFSWPQFFDWLIPSWSVLNNDSKRKKEYQKDIGAGWSLDDSASLWLRTETPTLSSTIRCLNQLLRVFADRQNRGLVTTVDSVVTELAEVRAKLKQAERAKTTAEQVVKRLNSIRATETTPRPILKVQEPKASDFDDDDDDLPEWEDRERM